MPTYEYKCKNCDHRFEKFQSIKSPAVKKCPECGKNTVERLISGGAGLIFKGSGFYITDYRDAAYTDKAKAEASAGKTESEAKPAGDSKSTESKPETKASDKPAAKSEANPASTETSSAKAEPKPAAKSSSKKK